MYSYDFDIAWAALLRDFFVLLLALMLTSCAMLVAWWLLRKSKLIP